MIRALLLIVAAPAAELGRLSGTFDGGTWELDLTAHSVADVVLDGDTVRVITTGGALGELDADTGALTRLTLPDVPLGGFVRGARRPLAFDVRGRIHAVVADGLVPTGRGPGRPGIRAAWSTPWGISTVEDRGEGRVTWRPALGPAYRLPESVVWARIGGRVAWGARYGEFGGGFGRGPWRLNKRLNVFTFGELDGRPVVAGGLCHLVCCDGTIRTLWGRQVHSAQRCSSFNDGLEELPADPLSQPVAWVGDVGGTATAVDVHGDIFVRDAGTWTPAGALRPPERALRVDRRVTVGAHARDEDRDTVWLAAPRHPPLRIGPGGAERTLPATAPFAEALRWRHGRLWALDETDVWERTRDGWIRHPQPPVPPGEDTALTAVLTGPDRPTWVWVDHAADVLRFDGPRAVGAGLIDDLLDAPDGGVLRVSLGSCPNGDPPCVVADFHLEGAHRWTVNGHVGRGHRWWDAEGTPVEPPEAEPGDWTQVALPLADGGWLVQRGTGQVERFDARGGRTSLGVLPRLHDLAEVDGRIWLLGARVWVLDGGALRALDLPSVGTVRWLEPMDPGAVALAAEAGVLVLRIDEPAHPTSPGG